MSEIDILFTDSETGLPPLPDGCFWRVARVQRDQPFDEWGYTSYHPVEFTPYAELQIVGIEDYDEVVSKKSRWGKKRTERVMKRREKILFRRDITTYLSDEVSIDNGDERKYPNHFARKQAELENIRHHAEVHAPKAGLVNRTRHYAGSYGYRDYYFFCDPTVSPQSILKTARRLLQDSEDERRARLEELRKQQEKEAKAAREEREKEERERIRNQYVGDYPPRILLDK